MPMGERDVARLVWEATRVSRHVMTAVLPLKVRLRGSHNVIFADGGHHCSNGIPESRTQAKLPCPEGILTALKASKLGRQTSVFRRACW